MLDFVYFVYSWFQNIEIVHDFFTKKRHRLQPPRPPMPIWRFSSRTKSIDDASLGGLVTIVQYMITHCSFPICAKPDGLTLIRYLFLNYLQMAKWHFGKYLSI